MYGLQLELLETHGLKKTIIISGFISYYDNQKTQYDNVILKGCDFI